MVCIYIQTLNAQSKSVIKSLKLLYFHAALTHLKKSPAFTQFFVWNLCCLFFNVKQKTIERKTEKTSSKCLEQQI